MIRPGSLSVREPRQTFSPDSGLRNLQLISQTRPTLQTQRKTRSFRRFLVETKRELLTSPVRSLEDFSSASSSPQEATDEKHEEGIKLARRTLQVTFTCNKCGERTARLVNPLAWQKGLVFAQCKGCEAWHKLRDNENLIDEVKFTE